ncbi:MAG: UvrD-helicase domain-containing protein [Alphaproteobacteria bacterium]|uniref:DNA 3'-5' helicase n=1 Tax=Candidatus Nitrobium versatile TaxID=2884831 RepID=A0A953J477_9BACT|nr:UvrD-helicase domain-containing protein [Candidatus Nitrobium versatile]
MAKEVLLEDLNPQQREAILHSKGPLLVLAGAGSGKTRVITQKFAYLIKKKNLSQHSIFTVTFTNKAADEMKERIARFVDGDMKSSWIGTFHSQCNKILRREIKALGFKTDFSIYDEDDQCNLVRHILKEFNMYEALYKGVASRISILKASLISPEEFLSQGDGFSFDEKLGRVYLKYQDELKRCNALDFDDLIMLTVKLFSEHPKILEKYMGMFPYLLVDEFQDTNPAQYKLLQLLSSAHRNICAVGDDDQSIYKFRGADVSNILNFEKDFPEAKIIKLEQNYRSTQNILDVSGAIIAKNPYRKPKTLWTDRGCGEKVYYCRLNSEDEEAKYVARGIKDLYLKNNYEYSSFAILYRVNLQARAIEDALREEGIPYNVISGISFYHRKEIKDIISYMRLALNHDDNVSLRRIINSPHRGIGTSTMAKIEQEAKRHSLSLFAAINSLLKANNVAATLKEKLQDFAKNMNTVSTTLYKNAADMLKDIVERTGYIEDIEEERLQNIMELISSTEGLSVKDFSERVALASASANGNTAKKSAVSLMTLHSAKGLEFPVVFIIGLEEGILPYFKAIDDPVEMQEERRLFYVGMTRAKEILCLTGSRRRKLYSRFQEQEPSRFLVDIPKECCQCMEKTVTQKAPVRPVKVASPNSSVPQYVVGSKVKHPAWGIGVIRDCCGDGDDTKVTVNFPSVGLKRLSVRHANLERI